MPGGIRRRKMAKSGSQTRRKIRKTKRTKSVEVLSNPIIAANWDRNLTLAQNYKKLGLKSKLNSPAGGVEKNIREDEVPAAKFKSTSTKTGRIVRDEDGTTKVVYEEEDSDVEEPDAKTEVVQQLEEMAKSGVIYQRHQSEREQDFLETLVRKHGDDYKAMQWDKKLNKFQQSAGDLKRRIRKWKQARGE